MREIRQAEPFDAPGMARVTVDTWFVAHQGQVSDESYQARRETWGYAESELGWRRSISEADTRSAQVLVATDEGRVVAVAAGELTGTDVAEVGALYVDVPHQRSGIGRRLLGELFSHYRNIGASTIHIAVLAANRPARNFYERLGGRNAATRENTEGREVVYAWQLDDVGVR